MSKEFKEPQITINKVYTKHGDTGNTSLVGGMKVKKNSSRICAFGEIDELNVAMGSCLSDKNISRLNVNKSIIKIQNDLFNLGNMLATPSEYLNDKSPIVTQESILYLESKIDLYNKSLKPLSSFVLPGGCDLSIKFHSARVLCRRSERFIVSILEQENINLIIVKYLNRLSDLLFVLSRYTNFILNEEELLWNPNFEDKP